VIVQHPRESRHPFGTARLAELSLARVRRLVDHAGCLRREPRRLLPLDGAALLYPHPAARDVCTLEPGERPRRLVVIDGTWHHARTLYRDVAGLRDLPHLTLPDHLRSAFLIRRQPMAHCLSTIEAIAHALLALEPDAGAFQELLCSFRLMQNRQLELPRNEGRSKRRRRARPSRAVPHALVGDPASLVVAYAESVLGRERAQPQLLSCAALRPSTGERFFGLVRRSGLTDAHLSHLGHAREEIDAGLSEEELRSRWSAFAGPGDTVACWSPSTAELLESIGIRTRTVLLKSAYHNLRRSRGSLEAIVRSEGLGAMPPDPRCRALRRLNNAAALLELLEAHARAAAPHADP
jgi:tRNA-uridine aminocarboxypropyltransferase